MHQIFLGALDHEFVSSPLSPAGVFDISTFSRVEIFPMTHSFWKKILLSTG